MRYFERVAAMFLYQIAKYGWAKACDRKDQMPGLGIAWNHLDPAGLAFAKGNAPSCFGY